MSGTEVSGTFVTGLLDRLSGELNYALRDAERTLNGAGAQPVLEVLVEGVQVVGYIVTASESEVCGTVEIWDGAAIKPLPEPMPNTAEGRERCARDLILGWLVARGDA